MATQNRHIHDRQRGATLIEFALVAMLMFLVFWGIFELSRDFYVRNTTQHLTRCMARAAVVHLPSNASVAKQECLMESGTWPLYYLGGGNLSGEFLLQYLLTPDPAAAACPLPTKGAASTQYCKTETAVQNGAYDAQPGECVAQAGRCIYYVRASFVGGSITGFGLLYSWIGSGGSIDEPPASTTMPAENMGWLPPS